VGFPPRFLDELRLRVPLTEAVAKRVKLTRRGREFVGLCPFHGEKTPSFTVSEEKGFYHCFGCGAHGDVITFVMEKEGLSFPEAVAQLAAQAGLVLPQMTPQERAAEGARAGLAEVNAAAAAWFADQLASVRGEEARAYVARRGLKGETARRFALGFAPPSRRLLKQALLAKGFAETLLVEAGLVIQPEDGGESYDRFRNRLMFPIRDRRARVIAFGGRAMEAQAHAKYLNSPETPLFHKGTTLYNLDRAQGPAREKAQIIVAEGYMDVIALDEAGFAHAVAPLGTALTEDQLRTLWRLAPEPLLCFDGDGAGIRAAFRAAERALPMLRPGYSLRFALLPKGEDPDSLVRGQGPAAFAAVLEKAVALAELLWDGLVAEADLATPERRAALARDAMAMARKVTDATLRRFYEEEMRRRLDRLLRPGGASRRRAGGRQPARRAGRRLAAPGVMADASPYLKATADNRTQGLEKIILATCLNHPGLLHSHAEELAALSLKNGLVDKALRHLLSLAAAREDLDSQAAKDTLRSEGHGRMLDGLERDPLVRRQSFAMKDASDAVAAGGLCHALGLWRRMVDLERERREAEADLARTGSEAAFQRLQHVLAELAGSAGRELDFTADGQAARRHEP
jgi:DNA primase